MKFETRETANLILREFSPEDRDALMQFVHKPGQLKFMLFSLKDAAEVDSFLTMAIEDQGRPDRHEYHLAVDLKTENGPVFAGSVDLMGGPDNPSEAELGYFFLESMWGRGYAVEAGRVLLDFAFGKPGLHRVWGKCHTMNAASARVMEKLGMLREGTMREHAWMGDHYRSSALYGILDREWKGHEKPH